MLKPEAARKRLEEWQVEGITGRGDLAERFGPAIGKLPSGLRAIAFAFLDRDPAGNEWKDKEWHEYQGLRARAARELDRQSGDKRTEVFATFYPRLARELELAWQARKSATYQIDG